MRHNRWSLNSKMGIKHLWTILTPFGQRKPLYELQGKRVAIDLSCWVCEAQNVTDNHVQPKMYLRNLYFRTCFLLLMRVHPIFVLEGKPPELKHDTILARNAALHNRQPKLGKTDRKHFDAVLRCCEEMLRLMGVACVKGQGEAEALCAYLNEDGLVDGCISQDSDCFAYGAQIVYRNFSISQQGAHSGAGAVDVYNINDVGFGRCKIIAMALLCGSDYGDGVFGVGKEAVVKLLEGLSDHEVLAKLRDWRCNSRRYEQMQRDLDNKNMCTSCGHSGKLQQHSKNGCILCSTMRGCDSSKYKDKRVEIKHELAIRNKALQDPDFPSEAVIDEFLVRKDNVSSLDLRWRQPDLASFVKFSVKHLQWEPEYATEKFLPIMTRWQLQNVETSVIVPSHIKKVRNPKGVPSYEIVWVNTECTTIEPQELVTNAYPALVQQFEDGRKPKRKPAKTRSKPIQSYFKLALTNNLDLSKFGDESDMDLSDVVETVVSRKLDLLKKASFFVTESVEHEDLFENSFSAVYDSSEEDEEYVPLLDRLQCK